MTSPQFTGILAAVVTPLTADPVLPLAPEYREELRGLLAAAGAPVESGPAGSAAR
jgi:hypothetical protein